MFSLNKVFEAKRFTLADAQARPLTGQLCWPVEIPQPEDWSIELQRGITCGSKAVNKKP